MESFGGREMFLKESLGCVFTQSWLPKLCYVRKILACKKMSPLWCDPPVTMTAVVSPPVAG